MKNKIAWGAWACLFVLCVWLGMLGQPEGIGKVLYFLTALIFFIPGALLLYWGFQNNDLQQIKAVRIVSAVSLGLTLITLVANFCSVLFSEAVGNALYIILVVVSAPMVCSGYWVLSMFLWACLLTASFLKKKQ